MEFLARVNPRYFAGIELFAAVKDVRYYICGVFIEPHPRGGVSIVATDGVRMAAIHDPEGWCKDKIIVGEIPRALIAACKKRKDITHTGPEHLWIGKDFAVVSTNPEKEPPKNPFSESALHAGKVSLIDGKFPNWRRVIPTDRKMEPAMIPAFNVELLATLQEAAKILSGTTSKNFDGCVRLYSAGENLALVARLIDSDLMDRFVAIMMPMRACEPTSVVPEFVKHAPAPKPKVKPRVKVRGAEIITE